MPINSTLLVRFKPSKTISVHPTIKPEKQVAKDILHSIVYLYIEVRAFSLAKEIVQKHKLVAKGKLKQKALRKEIQTAAAVAPQKNTKE